MDGRFYRGLMNGLMISALAWMVALWCVSPALRHTVIASTVDLFR